MTKRRTKFWPVFLVVLLIVSLYYWRPVTRVIDESAAYIAGSVLRYYRSVVRYIDVCGAKFQAKRELRWLLAQSERERLGLQSEVIQMRAEQRYIDDITELVRWRQQYAFLQNARILQVLFKHFGADEHYFLIAGGATEGITSNMIVILNNHLVGRVSAVFATYAKVQLITDKNLKIAACCAQTKAHGIYSGTGAVNQAVLNFVDHLQEIISGDMVLSSGTGLLYPQGLCLGRIVSFVKNDADYTIKLQPLISLEKIEYCFLVSATALQEVVAQQSVVTPVSVQVNNFEVDQEAQCAKPAVTLSHELESVLDG